MISLPRLSPTSYALLGLLARAPRSAYELNSVMQTSLIRVYWPRAESHVYSEPKKLLAHGYVSEQRETVKGRARSVYSITPEGREALGKWLADDEPAQLRSQAEFMLKLILADGGSADNAKSTLERAMTATETDLAQAIAGVEAVLNNPGFADEGMPWNGIAINLMADFLVARYRWGQYALNSAQAVSDSTPGEDKLRQGREAYTRALETMRAALNDK